MSLFLKGEISLPGDKSISHRAIIFASLSDGMCKVSNLGSGRDNRSTISILRNLGVTIKKQADTWLIKGVGLRGLKEPTNTLNAGNSGTTIRIMTGILSAQPFFSVLTGDKYLVKRPMKRIIEPLSMMGAKIYGRANNEYPPLAILGNNNLKGIDYKLKVASAQVKSSILLAGLYADGITTVTEPYLSRDHTERFMKYLNVPIRQEGFSTTITYTEHLPSFDLDVCGDISSASFFIVAATLLKDSDILIKNVGLNKTRTGILDVLTAMGADISLLNIHNRCGEPVGDIHVKGVTNLRGVTINGDIIPRLIDEIPIITVAAAFAEGTTVIDDAAELRVKESDRIKAMVTELKKLNINIEETESGMIIHGGNIPKFAKVKTYGDHRIAMSLSIFGLCSAKGVELDDKSSISVSFPQFFEKIKELTV